MSATGKWVKPGVPRKGWLCVGITDALDGSADWTPADGPLPDFERGLMHVCEMCEVQVIRYIHHMTHDDHEPLDCGCICAGNMERDLIGARHRETTFKNLAVRRRNFLGLKTWRVSRSGNQHISIKEGHALICWKLGKYRIRVHHKDEPEPRWGRRTYPTEGAAKLACFDFLQWVQVRS